eukprot:6672053-Pyramimonas_sp.AAC.1
MFDDPMAKLRFTQYVCQHAPKPVCLCTLTITAKKSLFVCIKLCRWPSHARRHFEAEGLDNRGSLSTRSAPWTGAPRCS